MAPRGKWISIHLKNKLWTIITFLCYKSDLSVRLSCIFLFNLKSENRRRFVSRTFSVVNEVFPMVWRTPWKNAAGPACERNNARPTGKGRWDAATVAPSPFLITVVLGTNTFVLKTFFNFFCSFSIDAFRLSFSSFVFVFRRRRRTLILQLSISFGKVLTFNICLTLLFYHNIVKF